MRLAADLPRRGAPRRIVAASVLGLLAGLGGTDSGSAQESVAAEAETARHLEGLPEGELFRPLLGDPKEPRTFASFLEAETEGRATHVGAVGFGERWGIVRRQGRHAGDGWQLGISGAVFAQFDLDAASKDLLNADYVVGFPLTWRRGRWSGRFNLYHQSSHLGDELLLRESAERVNLSFEAVEALLSRDVGRWRVYAGGDYLLSPEPEGLAPGLAHAGVEYRAPEPTLSVGHLGRGRWVGAVDLKAIEEHDWRIAWSLRAGLELTPAGGSGGGGRSWSFMVEAYDGAAPWGQFYDADLSYLGAGIHLGI